MSVERLEDRSLLAATLLGTVWQDLNSDGQQSGGEPAVEYAVAELFSSANGTVGDGDDVSLGTRITDSAGNYQFTGLAAGVNHYVVIRPPVGFAFTTQDTGPDATDSDVSATGVSAMFAPVDLSTVDLDAGLTGGAPAFGWVVGQGGAFTDESTSVAVDAAGNSYVSGVFSDTADFDSGPGAVNLTSAGNLDVYAAKYTAGGALVWVRRVGRTVSELGYGLAVDAAGNVLVVGSFNGTVDFDPGAGTANLTSAGSNDAFVLKLDAAGNFVWARRIGGTGFDQALGLKVDAGGNALVTGAFQGTAILDAGSGGPASLASAGIDDVFVAKYAPDGALVWGRRVGGTSSDIGNSLAVDAGGSVLVTGKFQGTADFDPGGGTSNLTSAGSNDVFVLKLDGAGNYVWAGRVGGSSGEVGHGVAVDSGGNVLVTGEFWGTADFDPGAGTANLTSAGDGDVFVLKLSAAGSYVWAGRVGGAGYDYGDDVVVDGGGNVMVTGYFEGLVDFDPGTGTANLISAGFEDAFILRLDTAGNYLWARPVGGTGSDGGGGLAIDPSGNVLVTGYFQGTADFDPSAGTFNLTAAGDYDGFLWRLSATSYLPPSVTGVYVRATGNASGTGSDEWFASYRSHLQTLGLGDSVLGYRVSSGADQLDTLPWLNVDTVSIQFSEGVDITSGDLQLLGSPEGPAVPSVASFDYNATTFVATWQFATPLPMNRYLVHLADGSVVDLSGLALDGEWTDGVSTASGNGAAGGDFAFRMNVVPGDVDNTEGVVFAEVGQMRLKIGRTTASGDYNYRQDLDGSGGMTFSEVAQAARFRVGTSIGGYTPPPPPPVSLGGGESLSEESLAGGTLLDKPAVAPEGTIDLDAWDAAILATYGQTKK